MRSSTRRAAVMSPPLAAVTTALTTASASPAISFSASRVARWRVPTFIPAGLPLTPGAHGPPLCVWPALSDSVVIWDLNGSSNGTASSSPGRSYPSRDCTLGLRRPICPWVGPPRREVEPRLGFTSRPVYVPRLRRPSTVNLGAPGKSLGTTAPTVSPNGRRAPGARRPHRTPSPPSRFNT